MLPKTSPEPTTDAAGAPVATESVLRSTSHRNVGSLVTRILAILVAIVGSVSALMIIGSLNFDSTALVLVALAVVAMIAALLFHSWWALLVIPAVNTVGSCGLGLGALLAEGFSHGAVDIREPGQLAIDIVLGALRWGVAPALVGASVGTLAWWGWGRWRARQAT